MAVFVAIATLPNKAFGYCEYPYLYNRLRAIMTYSELPIGTPHPLAHVMA